MTMMVGSRRLPEQHLSIRVPWHDAAWSGRVCDDPRANTSCLVLPRIGEGRDDDAQQALAGQTWDQLKPAQLPPCAEEHAGFMAPFEYARRVEHPYTKSSKLHEHFLPTQFVHQPYSAACIPFRWMLREHVLGDERRKIPSLVEQLKLGFDARREPELGFVADWIQEHDNQRIMLDTFFSAVDNEASLCVFYAKRTPLAEDHRRVIVGIGRVTNVGEPVEYKYRGSTPPLRSSLWERNVCHSIRTKNTDGFLLPYSQVLRVADQNPAIKPADLVAFAPNEHWDEFAYGTEHLSHDGAIASLLACSAAVHRISGVIEGQWGPVLNWIDSQLNRLWKLRGPYPGFGSALTAFGIEHGNLIGFEIGSRLTKPGDDPWPAFERFLQQPSIIGDTVPVRVGEGYRRTWQSLSDERRALLKLISRFAISDVQATRYYQHTERATAGISATDRALLQNPYLFFELDRGQADPIAFELIDRGAYPSAVIEEAHPLPKPSRLTDAVDGRRVRAVVAATLEDAAVQGHTVQSETAMVAAARERALDPPCPVSIDVIQSARSSFGPLITDIVFADGDHGFQLDRYSQTSSMISKSVTKRRDGARHSVPANWRRLIDDALPAALGDELEKRAHEEKAASLQELVESRITVLIGPAGTGKTTLLRVLTALPDVDRGGVLFLTPTGKARVRLEQQTGRRGAKTIAQFLNALGRFDTQTGRYLVTGSSQRETGYRTLVIDECSMLTEEQLASVLDAVSNVDRLILVGDPRQLPPIGAGRPFVDVVSYLTPENIETRFPRVGKGYAELTITHRQKGGRREDVRLAEWFSGRAMEPGADELWSELQSNESRHVRVASWSDGEELRHKLLDALVTELALSSVEDESGFEMSLGGTQYQGNTYFWEQKKDSAGAAAKAEAWQILSPVRAQLHGVDALNRLLQAQFRHSTLDRATPEIDYHRKIPRPIGAQRIVYGDKVINVINGVRYDVYPKPSEPAFVANGEMGMVVGQWRFKGMKTPWKAEVEFSSQPGVKYGYRQSEFGADGTPPLELAYALTVHKTQGSEFGLTFVVLPNPCLLLSRELLYTALTRQQVRIVILHQGDFRDLLRYSGDAYSEVAKRLTNLLREPTPIIVEVAGQSTFFEKGLIHRTERGELVRSKSEVLIADKLHANGVDYRYEQGLQLADGSWRYPDFTVADAESGLTFFWEHLGLLGDPDYAARWQRKLDAYQRDGITPVEQDSQSHRRLIVTRDDERGGFDSTTVARLIKQHLI